MFDNNMGSLQRWLINPQNVKEGSHMPNFMLNPKEIEALSTYLEGLK
jgi:cytochrome c1